MLMMRRRKAANGWIHQIIHLLLIWQQCLTIHSFAPSRLFCRHQYQETWHCNSNNHNIAVHASLDNDGSNDPVPVSLTERHTATRRWFIRGVIATATAVTSSLTALALDDVELKRISVFEKTSPSVVFIDTFVERRDAFSTNVLEVPLGSGSGFVWDTDGHVVTNYHVVRNAQSAQIAILTNAQNQKQLPPAQATVRPFTSMRGSDAKRSFFKATVVGVDPGKDIAVLKVDAPKSLLQPIHVGTSSGIRVGQQSLAIGNPFGLDHTLTVGVISGIGREVKSPIGRPITNVIQTDAAVNPGNSGGPLLDSSGNIIGMNTAIYSPSGASAGIGFAIPIDTVKFIVNTLIRDGKVIRPILGISFLESKQARALGIGSGVLVLDVPAGSPAALAGLKGTRRTEAGLIEVGDIITKVGDQIINTESDLFQALENCKVGDQVKLTVGRAVSAGEEIVLKEVELSITLQASTEFEKQRLPLPAPAYQ